MTPITCISLIAYLKREVYDGNGAALIEDWKALSDQDKQDLHDYATAEGANLTPLGVTA